MSMNTTQLTSPKPIIKSDCTQTATNDTAFSNNFNMPTRRITA